jgi:pimeloyl-ACP methyl ester carboxylesterase
MTKLETKYAVVNGIKISYLYGGKGPRLCFIHGWGPFDTNIWLLDELSKYFTVCAPNLYELRKTLKLPFYKNCVSVITELLKQINFTGVLMGHSFGGAVATGVAANNKGIKQLFLIDSAGVKLKRGRLKWILTYLRKTQKEAKAEKDHAVRSFKWKFVRFVIANLRLKTYRISCEVMELDVTDLFKKVKQSTIILWGKNDAIFNLAVANKIKRLIPNSKLVKVGGMHNWCLLRPKQLIETLESIQKKYK